MFKNKKLLKSSGTCLAVVRDNKTQELIFAGDRRISWGHMQYQVGSRPKICKRNGVLFAGTGVSYLCDLVCELSEVTKPANDETGFHYAHNTLFPNIRKVLIDKGYADKDNLLNVPEDFNAAILVGVKKELFEIGIDKNTGVTVDVIDAPFAHGCGGYYAMGSLEATEGEKLLSLKQKLRQRGFNPPKRFKVEDCRLVLALNSAAKHSAGCDANVDIIRESDEDTL